MPSAKAPLKTDKNTALPSFREGDAVPRLVAGEDGSILYANKAFETICGQDGLKGRTLTDILSFKTPDDAFRPVFSLQTEADNGVQHLRDGMHLVSFPGSGKAVTALQFDWVDTADGRRFLIASAQAEDKAFSDHVLSLVPARAPEAKKTRTGNTGFRDAELRRFLEMSDDLMAIADPDGRYIRTNQAFEDLTGYQAGDLQGKVFTELVHSDDRAHVRASLQGLMHAGGSGKGRAIDFEARIVTAGGTTLWMDWHYQRIGKKLYSTGRDITAVKRHELALARQEKQLSEAESIGKMGHWRWDVGQETLDWSDEIYKIFGVGRDAFIPTLDSINGMILKRDVSRMVQAFQRAIIERNDYDMDFRINHPGGETRYIRCEGRCETDADGDVTALYGIMQDVTETILHEKTLRETRDAAERAYAAKTQFLANMSHELRTPLNAIIGFSEMMQQQVLGPIGTEKYLDYVDGIHESGQHLLDIISDILDMSRIEAGKYELDLEAVDVARVIKSAVQMVENRAADSNLRIAVQIDNDARTIIADRRAVMQICLNLLSNAVKFTEEGGQVTIQCLERENSLSLKVHDTGIGIPAHKIKAVTKPFEQAESHYTRQHEGSGLGLAITKELVGLHGGSMHIDSTVGIGTTVTVRLPYDASKRS